MSVVSQSTSTPPSTSTCNDEDRSPPLPEVPPMSEADQAAVAMDVDTVNTANITTESTDDGEPEDTSSRSRSPVRTRSKDPPPVPEEIVKNLNVYILCETSQVEELWNTAFREHRHHGENECLGFLRMERTEVRIISVTYQIYCEDCDFTTAPVKLYKEVDTAGKRGRKFSTLNQALGIALLNSSIGPTGFREICMMLGLFPGNRKSLNRLCQQASQSVDDLAFESVTRAREEVMRRFPKGINIAWDGRYNNKYTTGVFQPATSCVFVTQEQDTEKKMVIDWKVYNKNCPEALRLLNLGEIDKITCPDPENKTHKCESNVAYHEPIGKEGEYAKNAALALKESGIDIISHTSDGDCKIGKAVAEVYPDAVHLKDSVHSAKSHKKAIAGEEFSTKMFPGPSKKSKKCQAWFALDISQRCSAELKKAAHKTKNISDKQKKISKMNSLLKYVPNAIIQCYTGKHTLCDKYSLVCKPTNHWGKKALAEGQTDKMLFTLGDRKKIKVSILKRLGPTAVSQTYLNSNTNSVESFNRKLAKSYGKNITHGPQTTIGRVAASVVQKNEGFELAVTQSQHKIRHEVSVEIKKTIKSEALQRKKGLEKKKTKAAKQKRVDLRANKKKLWEAKGSTDMTNIYTSGVDINP